MYKATIPLWWITAVRDILYTVAHQPSPMGAQAEILGTHIPEMIESITMDYYESAEGLLITRQRAIQECEKHGASAEEMLAEIGDHQQYDAQAVLAWLGY